MDAIETVKRELKYNSGPAIAYVRVGTSDAQQLVKMAETSLKQAEEIAKLRKALEFYADRESWAFHANEYDVHDDRGMTARGALK